MSDSTPTQPAAEAIEPYLEKARGLGLDFRPLTGLSVKRATRLGIDIDELGKSTDSNLADETYYDHVMVVCWLLCAPEAEIAAAIAGKAEWSVAEAWQAARILTLEHDATAMRCFMARWLEYRIEMDRVFGSPAAPAADK